MTFQKIKGKWIRLSCPLGRVRGTTKAFHSYCTNHWDFWCYKCTIRKNFGCHDAGDFPRIKLSGGIYCFLMKERRKTKGKYGIHL